MLTRTEKGYLAMTLAFLAAGSGIKAYRNTSIRLGPFPGPAIALNGAPARPSPASDTLKPAPAAGSSGDSSQAPRPETSQRPEVSERPAAPVSRGDSDTSAAGSGHGPVKSAFTGKVDLNRADERELTSVRGLGEKTARAIVAYRKAHGPYRRLRDLLQVKGIGEKKLEKLGPYLIL